MVDAAFASTKTDLNAFINGQTIYIFPQILWKGCKIKQRFLLLLKAFLQTVLGLVLHGMILFILIK